MNDHHAEKNLGFSGSQNIVCGLLQELGNPVGIRHIAIAVICAGIHGERRRVAITQTRHHLCRPGALAVVRNVQPGLDMKNAAQPESGLNGRRQRVERHVTFR